MSEGQAAAQLHAVGAMLGVEVTVADGEEWHVDARGLRVGLDWYLRRGHGEREAVALAALQLWEGPRELMRAPERARRASAIERSRPWLAPLLGSVRRAQAMGELLTSMPGLRTPVQTAVFRGLPGDLSAIPRHVQWACLVLASGVPQARSVRGEDHAVAAEWQAMLAAAGDDGLAFNALDRVLSPRHGVTPLRRLERALALLLPGYERLLALDVADQGVQPTVLGGSDRAELSLRADDRLGSEDFAPSDEEQPGEASPNDDQPNDQESERDSTSGVPDPDELFASARERFAQTVLATPIPDAAALLDAMRQLDEATAEALDDAASHAGGAGVAAAPAVTLAAYRAKAEQLAVAIDGVRAVWQSVISERVAPRSSRSRIPVSDGDELARDALVGAVAQTLAGVREPAAFTRRVTKPRLARSAGSTDYVLMVDRSASMTGAVADAAADAALVMIEALAAAERDIAHAERSAGIDLELDIRSSLIVFAAEATVLKPLSHGLDDAARRRLFAEVRSPGGSTNDAAALRTAGEQLGIDLLRGAHSVDGLARRRIAILVGDGGTNDAPAAARELQRLRAAGVSVHAVGIGTDDLAVRYAPQGTSIADARELPAALARIIEREL